MSEPGNQFSLARAASITGGAAKTNFLSVIVSLAACLFGPNPVTAALAPQLGPKRILVMLVDFPDSRNTAPTASTVSNAMLSVDAFFRSNSFNQVSITSTVIGPLHLPSPSSSYVSSFNVSGLRTDALAAASARGYDSTNFDYDVVTFTNIGFSFYGWATIGTRGAWVQTFQGFPFTDTVVDHELGHNFGLGHAHAWVSPTVIGDGTSSDTGNPFDTMGSGASHYNSNFKFLLDWIPTNCAQTVTTNGVYRIYAEDGGGDLRTDRKYSLVIPAGVTTPAAPEDYWVECRQLIDNATLLNGVLVMWANAASPNDCYLLDSTPGSQVGGADALDSAVTIGRSFTDPNKRITIAPVGKGGVHADAYFDVQVTINSSVIPPTITAQPVNQLLSAGGGGALSVSAVSSSPILYQWFRYGSLVSGATTSALLIDNASADQAGDYTVVLSNSLGSVVSSSAALTVNYAPSPSCYPTPGGMVAWWTGDDHPLDWISTNHGVLQGSAAYARGVVNQAFALNGTTDFIEVPHSSAWAFGTRAFSIELWVNFSAVGGDRIFLGDDNGPGQLDKWFFWLNDQQLRFYAVNAGGGSDNVGTARFLPSTNQWYHLAVTRSATTFTFYINGGPVSTNTSIVTVPSPTAPLTIGAAEGADFIAGRLDEIRIYTRALSAADILSIYAAGSTGVCWPPNPPSYVELSRPAVAVQASAENASLLIRRTGNTATTVSVNCLSSNGTAMAGVDYVPVSNLITFEGSESTKTLNIGILNDGVASGTKQFTVSLSGVSTNAVVGAQSTGTVTIVDNSCVPPPAGLIGWWSADGNANDLANTNNGLLHSGAGYAPGKVGLGFLLPSAPAYISVPQNSLWAFGANDFTLELWVDFSAVSGSQALMASDRGGGSQPKWIFWLSGGVLQLHVNGTQLAYVSSSAFSPKTNQWYHLVLTRSNSTFTFYTNGNRFSATSAMVSIPDSGSPLTFGQAEGAFNLSGILDDLRIYDRALSHVEVQAIYNSSSNGMCPPSPPVLTAQPQSQTVEVGANVTFTCSAGGFSPLSYQWQVNGSNIVEATASSLSLTNVQTVDTGEYSVVVTNVAGSITSTSAMLIVNPPLPMTFQSIMRLPDGSIVLVINGKPGSVNTLEFSTDLFSWQILTNITLLDVPLILTNSPTINSTKGFYRTFSIGTAQ